MKVPAAVVFDCGGTLVHIDSALVRNALDDAGIAYPAGVNLAASLARAGDMDKWALPDLRTLDPFFDLWAFISGVTDPRAPSVLRRVIHEEPVYTLLDPDASFTFSGLRERGIRVAVLANDDGELADELDRFGLAHLVDVAVSSHVVGLRKPDPAAFDVVTDQLGLCPERCWYVGDAVLNDYLGSLQAGFDAAIAYDRYDGLAAVAVRRVQRLGQVLDLVDQVVGHP